MSLPTPHHQLRHLPNPPPRLLNRLMRIIPIHSPNPPPSIGESTARVPARTHHLLDAIYTARAPQVLERLLDCERGREYKFNIAFVGAAAVPGQGAAVPEMDGALVVGVW